MKLSFKFSNPIAQGGDLDGKIPHSIPNFNDRSGGTRIDAVTIEVDSFQS
jgi:hypothetical protein